MIDISSDAEDDDFETPTRMNRSKSMKMKAKSAVKGNTSRRLAGCPVEDGADTTVDLFGDSFDESMMDAVCKTIDQGGGPHCKTKNKTVTTVAASNNSSSVKKSTFASKSTSVKKSASANKSTSVNKSADTSNQRISSQFNIDLDEL